MNINSDDYKSGYSDGVNTGKAIAIEMCENVFKSRTCKTCGWLDEFDGCNISIYHYDIPALIELSGCGKWESRK